jgi:hypothetical protein
MPLRTGKCPGFTKYNNQQAQKCGILDWIEGFKKIG